MSFSFIDLSRERKVPIFIISSGEAEEPSEGTGREVGWAGLGLAGTLLRN